MAVIIKDVVKNSICYKKGIRKNWSLVSINGNEITDVLDYEFYIKENKLIMYFKFEGKKIVKKISKDETEDIGLMFETYLMDKQRSCTNKCIFCFIDQLPSGMRKSLYFKDDDARLSFLMGNYITLTNMTDREVQRIIKMHISPINISVHTTNPELRVKMMGNKRAGECLKYIQSFAEANISMNIQLVLCNGINDGKELERSLEELSRYFPSISSIAAVPVGLTKFREELFRLNPYDTESAKNVVEIIHKYGNKFLQEYGSRICFPADEFYLKANMQIPDASFYGDFEQLENGVGMWALLKSEFLRALNDADYNDNKSRNVAIATGTSAYKLFTEIVDLLKKKWHNLEVDIYSVENNFFGTSINVSGLITGQDYYEQLKDKDLGEELLISASSLKRGEDVFLDDMTLEELSRKLNVKVTPVENDGYVLLQKILDKQ